MAPARAYIISNGAMVMLKRFAAIDCGTKNIRANAVAPGEVEIRLVVNSSDGFGIRYWHKLHSVGWGLLLK